MQGWRAANSDNPARFDKDTAAGFPKVGDSKHFKAVPVAELPSVFAALPDTPAGNAVRFQILTAARPGATEAATWSQIKSDNGTSSWEYTVLKGGKPFEQRVPLTPAALALLGERKADDAPLFTLVSNVMLKAIKKASGDDEMTVHGTAKSTFNQWCDDTGIEQGLIDASLAHYEALHYLSSSLPAPLSSCAPPTVTHLQAATVVVRRLDKHPERWHEDFVLLALLTLA